MADVADGRKINSLSGLKYFNKNYFFALKKIVGRKHVVYHTARNCNFSEAPQVQINIIKCQKHKH
jgi:hypothetical protein